MKVPYSLTFFVVLLSSTRWVRSTLSSFCTVHSFLSSAVPWINLCDIENKSSGTRRIEPGAAGWEARTLPLCYATPLLLFTHFISINTNIFAARSSRPLWADVAGPSWPPGRRNPGLVRVGGGGLERGLGLGRLRHRVADSGLESRLRSRRMLRHIKCNYIFSDFYF